MIGWTAVIFAVQSWLSETPAQKAAASTPSYFSIGMALLSVGVVSITLKHAIRQTLTNSQAYMPLFLPPQGKAMGAGAGSGTAAPSPVPLS